MAFHVGQKVVCVNTEPRQGYAPFDPDEAPETGRVYTITRLFVSREGVLMFDLVEIARNALSKQQWKGDCGYGAWRFRPVQERKTDISIFTEMLKPKQRELCGNE